MSFVTIAPEYVEAAAQDLAGIGSSLSEATSAAAAPTIGLAPAAADEVSAAIAALFGDHGQQFQALAARASAFHEQFVGLLNSGAGAYLSTEAANAEQTLAASAPSFGGGAAGAVAQAESAVASSLSQSITGFQTGFAALETGGVPGLINDVNSFGATVAAPYQTLFSTTGANWQSLETAISANPAPLMHQINQLGYAQAIGTGFQSTVQNLPAELANLPMNIQAAQALSAANPAALAQLFINHQIGYAQTISTSLQAAAHDFTTGLQGLPTSFQTAFQDLAAGNITGAESAIGSGFSHLFIASYNVTGTNVISVTPTGTLGDLLPILSIPGQMAQNFTNMLPAGSLPAQMSQNFTNLVNTVTDTSLTSTASFLAPPGFGININTTAGLPLVLGIEALGAPLNALNALGSSATTFVNAVQTGNVVGATAAVLDAPAAVANGFLNGQSTLPLSIDVTGLPVTINIPMDGLLVPATEYTATVPGLSEFGFQGLVTGTPIGGLLPGLLTYLPADLAAALGGPPPPVIPLTL
ncbi:MAG: PE family protein [Mycobacterium sp.]|uniref:PE family protein n=1 Tax=Mycobacterium sp. TaxID=1785 RepID=UPI003F98B300